MKRLSLEELKAQKGGHVSQNLESIKGGDIDWCHVADRLRQALKDFAAGGPVFPPM